MVFSTPTPSGGDGALLGQDGRHDSGVQEGESAVLLDRIVEGIGFGAFQICLTLLAALIGCGVSIEFSILSFLAPCLQDDSDWQLSADDVSLLVALATSGSIAGSLTGGAVADLYGRRTAIIMGTGVTTLFGVLSACVPANQGPGFGLLVFCQAMTGFGNGACISASTALLIEYQPTAWRGAAGVVATMCFSLGGVFTTLFAWEVLAADEWRRFLIVCIAPVAFAFLVCILLLPESPRWLYKNRRYAEVLNNLNKLERTNACFGRNGGMPADARATLQKLIANKAEEDALRQSMAVSQGTVRAWCCVTFGSGDGLHTDAMHGEKGEKKGFVASTIEAYASLFNPTYRSLTMKIWPLWALWNFCFNGILLYDTILFKNTGGEEYEEEASCDFDYPSLVYVAIVGIPGQILAIYLVQSVGRKWTQISCYLIAAVFIAFARNDDGLNRALWESSAYLSRAFMLAGISASVLTTSESYPTRMRASAQSAANTIGVLCSLPASYLVYSEGLIMLPKTLVFASFFVGTSAIAFVLSETRDVVLDVNPSAFTPKFSRLRYDVLKAAETDGYSAAGMQKPRGESEGTPYTP